MSKKFWSFRAQEETNSADLTLYGEISDVTWWGDEITPQLFKSEMDALGDISLLNIYINSPGGDVFAGQTIYNIIKRHKAQVHVFVDGLAASIASVIAMAGDTISMPRNSMMMVHNPWTITMGDSNELRKMADTLDQVRESMITVYQDKTGQKKDKIIELLDAETWLTAEEAVNLGFADEIEEEKNIAASLKAGMLMVNGVEVDLSRFSNPPKLAFLTPPGKPQEEEQTGDGLLSLYQAQTTINKNRRL